MTARLDPWKIAPALLKPLLDLEAGIKNSGLDYSLIELVKTRAGMANPSCGCICLPRGASPRYTVSANARRWLGQKR